MADIERVITVNLNTAIDRVIRAPGLEVGQHLMGEELSRYPAGKAVNVSRALARLGRSCLATGFVGGDDLRYFEDWLGHTGPGKVLCQLLPVAGRTRENITLIDPESHQDLHIRLPGFEVTRQDYRRMLTKLGLLARPRTLFVFSGSLPQGFDLVDLSWLVEKVVSGGGAVALDIGGGEKKVLQCPQVPRDKRSAVWLMAPNESELRGILEVNEHAGKDELIEGARQLACYAQWVAVTRGAHGAWLVSKDIALEGELPLDQEKIVHTVGCGDCFLAGLLDSQLNESPAEEALGMALAAAAANALATAVADFDRTMVESLARQAQIRQIDG